jgi:prephenate dehydrogenase
MNPYFDRVVIVGAGLLGASLGMALQARKAAGHVVGVGRRQSSLDKALAAGSIHEGSLDLAESARDADLIVVATPANAVTSTLDVLRGSCPPKASVIDVASTKKDICTHGATLWKAPRRFVGCHPMAGSEKSGPENAIATLYNDSVCLVEDSPDLCPDAADSVRALWECVGARVVPIDPALHDAILARSSHVPHILASILATVAHRESATRDFVGNGFRDTTRIAEGSPEMWRDITLTNRDAIAGGLRAVKNEIDAYLAALDGGDPEEITALFQAGKEARKEVLAE